MREFKIICHMISSVDGRLVTDRWSKPKKEVDLTDVYESTAKTFNAKAWIVGRVTLSDYDESVSSDVSALSPDLQTKNSSNFIGNHENRPLAIVYDLKAKLRFTKNHLSTGEHIVVILSKLVDYSHIKYLQDLGISYFFANEGGADALYKPLQDIAEQFDVDTFLLEGGGIINGEFFRYNLVDELSVIIYPGLDGLYDSPAIIGYRGADTNHPCKDARLSLIECKSYPNDCVWLHYQVI